MIGKILTNELNSLYIVGNLTGRILLANCQIVKFIKTPRTVVGVCVCVQHKTLRIAYLHIFKQVQTTPGYLNDIMHIINTPELPIHWDTVIEIVNKN